MRASAQTELTRPLAIGEQLGPYELVKKLASGGMGSVYLGRRTGPGGFERLVAVKVLHDHLRDDPDFVAMFLDEARLAAAIRHANVVPTLEIANDTHLYMVMEYVEGTTLQRLQKRAAEGAPLPVAVGLRIIIDVLHGLHAAHELCDPEGRPLNVIHRDVSPHNILIGNEGVARLTDFGVARAARRQAVTQGKTIKGKFAYMPPEQLRDRTIDRRADVFAAGVVLWEALTGTHLFRRGTDAETISGVLSGPIHAPSSQRPDIPPVLDRITLCALDRDPARRFATAEAFANAILTAGVPIASRAEVSRHVRDAGSGSSISKVEPDAHLAQDQGALPTRSETRSRPRASEPPTIRRAALMLIGLLAVALLSAGWVLWWARPRRQPATIPSAANQPVQDRVQRTRTYLGASNPREALNVPNSAASASAPAKTITAPRPQASAPAPAPPSRRSVEPRPSINRRGPTRSRHHAASSDNYMPIGL